MKPGLWLPPHAGELLTVEVDGLCDDWEFQAMLDINESAFKLVNGQLDLSTFCDTLAHYGFDPIEFILPVLEDYTE
jgi:hypothetical protein